ncbi:hypothetical protein ACOKM5_43910 [Streptomyces sp. BH097]|uniref:hypothetical protein n=1 Tax=unclassified Streptomyces TaxID=2593676 RepID=UPI003BB5ADBC
MGATKQRVFAGLDAEWALVCADPAAGALVRGWTLQAGVVAEADELPHDLHDLVVHCRQQRGAGAGDRWLRVLLQRAAGEGEQAQLAARVVVQAMVPGMVRLTRSLLTPVREFDDVAQVVVGCLYMVVREFPLHRQSKVASTLLLESLHHASRELGDFEARDVRIDDLGDQADGSQNDVADEVAQRLLIERCQDQRGAGDADAPETGSAEGELAALLAWGVDRGCLPLEHARTIADLVREEAGRAGAATPAARKRRSRAIQWLRPVAAEWVAAA